MHVYYRKKIEKLKIRWKNANSSQVQHPRIATNRIVINFFPEHFPGVPAMVEWGAASYWKPILLTWLVRTIICDGWGGHMRMSGTSWGLQGLSSFPSALSWIQLICHFGLKWWAMLTSFPPTLWFSSLEHMCILLVSWFLSALHVIAGVCQSP